MRLALNGKTVNEGEFQSTHPLRGATSIFSNRPRLRKISIHAPLAGCDTKSKITFSDDYHFNPRTPCGVRHGCRACCGGGGLFQSTHPLRGATRVETIYLIPMIFQSTHPLRGATTPFVVDNDSKAISIHAPLAGCDTLVMHGRALLEIFQSTHPLRGATLLRPYGRRGRKNFNPRTPCGVRQQKRTKKTALF